MKLNYFSLCNLSIATTDKILSHIQHHVKNFFSLWKLNSFELFQPNMLYTKSSLLHKLSLSSRLCATAKTILSHWDINVKHYFHFYFDKCNSNSDCFTFGNGKTNYFTYSRSDFNTKQQLLYRWWFIVRLCNSYPYCLWHLPLLTLRVLFAKKFH